ncbi:TPA: phage antirepressor KilAC domain-containing protein [Clostridioides difficile]|nr:phage antirepressor KilAC domain-containing protein [Clostridioides difficile]
MEIINQNVEQVLIKEFNGNQIYTFVWKDKPCWIASQIAGLFGYADSSKTIFQCIDTEEFELGKEYEVLKGEALRIFKETTLKVIPSMKYVSSLTIFYEDGLYGFLQYTNKPIGIKFRKWLRTEVLPSIRKHGAYMTNEALERAINDPDWTIQLLTELKRERATKEKLKVEQEKNKPKLELANAIESSSNSILIAQLSKILNQNGVDIGQNRLFEWMRNNEYLIRKKRADHNTPTQKSMDLKILEVSESTGVDKDGNTIVRYTPIVTGKGQIYFLNKILKENSQVLKRFMINNDYIKGVMVEIGKTYAIYDHEYYGFIGILKSVRNEKIRVEEIGDISRSRDIPICMIDYIEEASKEDIDKYLSK